MAKLLDEVKTLAKLTEAEVAKVHAAIDAWFVKHFHGNSISADTDKFNMCQAAKEDLKTIVTPPVVAASSAPAADASATVKTAS